MISIVFACLVSYLLGTIPTALIVVRIFSKRDVRSEGSKNVGGMNTFRMLKKYKSISYATLGFAIVLVVDMGKAIAAVVISRYFIPSPILAMTIGTLFAILGHNYPVFLRFKGGKGAACLIGVMVYYNPIVFIGWILTIFSFIMAVEIVIRILQKKPFGLHTVFHAISEQILGRIIGEIAGLYAVYIIDKRLFIPVLAGSIFIIISHNMRLSYQVKKLFVARSK